MPVHARNSLAIAPPFPRLDALLFPARRHLLAARGTLTEIFFAVGDRGRTLTDDLGLKVCHNRLDLALLQPRSRCRRLLVANLRVGHPEALLALGPSELVEMRHCGAARDTAADDLDQL